MRPVRLALAALALTLVSPAAVPARAAAERAAASPPPRTAVIETALGDIVIDLFPADAPKTVANFVQRARQGLYDGTTFHRVVPGFVIQGGDPNSRDEDPFNDGQGCGESTVPAEIHRTHVRGAVAMARLPDAVNPKRASNGCQFYIALRALPSLDQGGYTVFGQVRSGWDTIDKIVALANDPGIARVNNSANPGKRALIRRVRIGAVATSRAEAPDSAGTPAAAPDSARR